MVDILFYIFIYGVFIPYAVITLYQMTFGENAYEIKRLQKENEYQNQKIQDLKNQIRLLNQIKKSAEDVINHTYMISSTLNNHNLKQTSLVVKNFLHIVQDVNRELQHFKDI